MWLLFIIKCSWCIKCSKRWTSNPRRTGVHCMELLWVFIISTS